MFCREQVAQLRDINPQIEAAGAELTVIGNGNKEQAASFAEERDLNFRLLTDPGLRSYKAADLKRSVMSTFRPSLVANGARAMKAGFRQGTVQGDAFQQGGAFVVAKGGELLFEQRSDVAGDHVEMDALLAALKAR